MLKTVIFDIDGTLLNTEPVYMQAWMEAGKLFGYHVTREALLQTRAVSKQIAIERLQYYCGADFPYDTVRKERVRIAEELFQITPPEQLRMPGALETLQWLKDRKITLAAATSTERDQTMAHLAQSELTGFFSAIVCGDMVEKGKPDPEIFLRAAELVGADPKECLVVGDTPADVLAAAAAGMKMVLIPDQVPANEKILASSWKCLENLYQLQSLLSTEQIG